MTCPSAHVVWRRDVSHYKPFAEITADIEVPGRTENDAAAQRIASTADDFARQFLTRSARLKYWEAALERYAASFKDYDASLDMTAIFA